MSILIDKAELMRHIENEMREWGDEYDALQILGDIEDFPTVEGVVGVVRCKDCRLSDGYYGECPMEFIDLEGFCYKGERREDAEIH